MDVIIHMAAVSPSLETRNFDFVQHNILGTERLIALAARAGVHKFVFFSSLSLYGDIRTPVVDENTPVLNPSPYGASKLFGEFLLRERVQEMNSIALRLPAVLGKGATRHWLASITAQARRGQDVKIYNPNAPFNNAIHIDDLAEFINGLLHWKWTGFDGITLGAEGSLTIAEIATRVTQAAGQSAKVVIDPEPRPSFTVSSERAGAIYGYKAGRFAAILNRYLAES
jgi:UDP-glucose 4-epimerase